ncbi:hypothetical protein C8R46DRAFT_181718 [Mycena filopes]|nr:hypothetical protein C8R46DRAFT_181718 [Mycena filopes]
MVRRCPCRLPVVLRPVPRRRPLHCVWSRSRPSPATRVTGVPPKIVPRERYCIDRVAFSPSLDVVLVCAEPEYLPHMCLCSLRPTPVAIQTNPCRTRRAARGSAWIRSCFLFFLILLLSCPTRRASDTVAHPEQLEGLFTNYKTFQAYFWWRLLARVALRGAYCAHPHRPVRNRHRVSSTRTPPARLFAGLPLPGGADSHFRFRVPVPSWCMRRICGRELSITAIANSGDPHVTRRWRRGLALVPVRRGDIFVCLHPLRGGCAAPIFSMVSLWVLHWDAGFIRSFFVAFQILGCTSNVPRHLSI